MPNTYVTLGLLLALSVLYFSIKKTGYFYKVSKDATLRQKYAKDISVFAQTPSKIFFPSSVAEVVQIVKRVSKERLTDAAASVTVRAGGTCMSGGALTAGAVLDMTRHMKRVKIYPKKQTAVVEAGAYFRDIEDAAAKHGLMFAPYPSSKKICGIGGMIGNNASGEKSIRFGATSDNILSLEVVLADGSVETVTSKPLAEATTKRERGITDLAGTYGEMLTEATGEVTKAASAYRLEKVLEGETFSAIPLFCGAQGTLGIVTKATLKLVPLPKNLSLLLISATKLEDIPVIVDEIFKWSPEAIETFDQNTFAKAREHLSDHANRMLSYVVEDANIFIFAEFSEEVADKNVLAEGCVDALTRMGYVAKRVTDAVDAASAWEVRRHSFLLMRDYNESGFKAVPCIEDVIVPVPALAEFISELSAILKRRGIQYGFHGHIGDGSLRIVPVFDVTNPQVTEEIVGLMREVFALIKRLKGNISADHSDGIIRSPFLREFYGEELYRVMGEIKRIYDPQNIMNPGKKVGVEIEAITRLFDTAV